MSMCSKNEKVLKLSTNGNRYFGCNKLKKIIKANHIKGGVALKRNNWSLIAPNGPSLELTVATMVSSRDLWGRLECKQQMSSSWLHLWPLQQLWYSSSTTADPHTHPHPTTTTSWPSLHQPVSSIPYFSIHYWQIFPEFVLALTKTLFLCFIELNKDASRTSGGFITKAARAAQ